MQTLLSGGFFYFRQIARIPGGSALSGVSVAASTALATHIFCEPLAKNIEAFAINQKLGYIVQYENR
jgi:hypothetical protein